MSRTAETFKTTVELIAYLNLPENQMITDLAVVRWDGRWPIIAKSRLTELNDPTNIGFAITLLIEHKNRAIGKEHGSTEEN